MGAIGQTGRKVKIGREKRQTEGIRRARKGQWRHGRNRKRDKERRGKN